MSINKGLANAGEYPGKLDRENVVLPVAKAKTRPFTPGKSCGAPKPKVNKKA